MNHYRKPPALVARLANPALAFIIKRFGLSPAGAQVLTVRDRTSGAPRSVPVNPLSFQGERYLVAPRGNTEWVRNLREAGEGELRLGRTRTRFRATEVADEVRPIRIWYQSFVDPEQQQPYIDRLTCYLKTIADPGVSFDVHGMTPPDHALHRLTEFRCAAQAIRNAIEAERQKYDAFVLGHFQDPGLYEIRSAVDLPVLGLGEGSMLHACSLGRKTGLVTIEPIFIPFHEEQIAHYGLQQRVVAVRAIRTSVDDYMAAFDDPETYRSVREQFVGQVEPLVSDGVEVVIPAGGLPMMLFLQEQAFTVGGAVVLNGIAVVAKMAELAVTLRRLNGTVTSRASTFALPPAQAVREFLDS